MPSFPQIPVLFCYIDHGQVQKKFHALCSSVPRVGEQVAPQAGSPVVVVHAVIHRAEMMPGAIPAMIPQVFLRELTPEEQASLGSILNTSRQVAK
jgi:hypothetical protein